METFPTSHSIVETMVRLLPVQAPTYQIFDFSRSRSTYGNWEHYGHREFHSGLLCYSLGTFGLKMRILPFYCRVSTGIDSVKLGVDIISPWFFNFYFF